MELVSACPRFGFIHSIKYIFSILLTFVFIACGGSGGGAPDPTPPAISNDATLSTLTINGVVLDQTFRSGVFAYTATADPTTDSVTVNATTTSPTATMSVNTVAVNSGENSQAIAVSDGTNLVRIDVTAEDGVTVQTYYISIARNNGNASVRLMSLEISQGTFSPLFAPDNTFLRVDLDFSVTEVTFTAVPEEPTSTMTINGLPLTNGVPSVPIILTVGENFIHIQVRSANGSQVREYTIIVTRQSNTNFAEQAYIKATNTDGDDFFGYNVALSGDTMAVTAIKESSDGSSQADDSLTDAGAVYIFVRGPFGVWSQQAYIKSPSPQMDEAFGIALALSGDTLVVTGQDVYVYTRSVFNTWSLEDTLVKPVVNPGALTPPAFGLSLAIEGDVLAVGAFGESSDATDIDGDESSISAAGLSSGAVYIYERQAIIIAGDPVWAKTHYIKASNTGANDLFGTAVAMHGDTLVVGATGEASDSNLTDVSQGDDSALRAGAAYIYVRNNVTGNWAQQAYLKASNSNTLDEFGGAVDISGDTIVVGAKFENGSAQSVNGNDTLNDSSDAGAAYVFVRDAFDVWTQQAYLKASKTRSFYEFGHDVAVSGSQIMVGSFKEGSGVQDINSIPETGVDLAPLSGATYLYNRSGTNWTLDAYVKASNAGLGDSFGNSVDVENGVMAVGAFTEWGADAGVYADKTSNAAPGAGAVYIFE